MESYDVLTEIGCIYEKLIAEAEKPMAAPVISMEEYRKRKDDTLKTLFKKV